MSETLSTNSLKSLFRFPFESPGWQGRFLVGSALLLASYAIPIIPAIWVGGYVLRVMRQTVEGREPELPAWNNWGNLTRDGLRTMAVSLVYFLPAILVMILGMGLYFAATLYLPFAAESGSQAIESVGNVLLLTFGSMAVMFVSMFVGTLLFLLGAIAMPLATAHFVAEGQLKAAFRLRQWGRILAADKLGYLIAWVIVAGLVAVLYMGVVMAYYTLILCALVPILAAPLTFYVLLVGAALFGETYRHSAADRLVH